MHGDSKVCLIEIVLNVSGNKMRVSGETLIFCYNYAPFNLLHFSIFTFLHVKIPLLLIAHLCSNSL